MQTTSADKPDEAGNGQEASFLCCTGAGAVGQPGSGKGQPLPPPHPGPYLMTAR
jgi:hypothetical protein